MSGIRQTSFAFLASAAAILSPVLTRADGARSQQLHTLYAFKDYVVGPMTFDSAAGIYVPIETGKNGLYIIDVQPNGDKWFLTNQSVLIHGGKFARNSVTDIKMDSNGDLVGISCDTRPGDQDSAFKLSNNLQTLQALATWPNVSRYTDQPTCGTNSVALISQNRIGLSTDYDDGNRGVISEWMLTEKQGIWHGPKTIYDTHGYQYVPFPYVINKSTLLGYDNYGGANNTGAIQSLTRDTRDQWQRSDLFALPKDDSYGYWVNSFAYANGTMVAASDRDTKNGSGYMFQLVPNGNGGLNPIMIDQNPSEGSIVALSPDGQNLCRVSSINLQYGTLDCYAYKNGAFQKTLSEVTKTINEMYQGVLINDSNEAFVLSWLYSRPHPLVLKGTQIPRGPQ